MPANPFAPLKRLTALLFAGPLVACSPAPVAVSLDFAAAFNGQPIACATAEPDVQLTDLRFYVHDVVLIADDGSSLAVTLTPDGIWQDDSVALVDLETGDGACLNGTRETHATVAGTYAGGNVSGIRFRVGVPEEFNHQDPLTAAPPLGYSVMHWHWASGYKFVRAGLEQNDDSVFLHLGSSRCEGTIGDIRGCKSANRPLVHLDAFNPESDLVVFDLGMLFQATNLDDGERTECMSGPANRDCEAPFLQLGIDMATGDAAGAAPAFTARPKP